jgi:hypothetical protein
MGNSTNSRYEAQRAYFLANKEKIYAYRREWSKKNREACNKYQKDWRKENPAAYKAGQGRWRSKMESKEALNSWSRGRTRMLRLKVIEAYGSECACCGETEPAFLTLDHINGGGNKHRMEVCGNASTASFYTWVIRNGFPRDILRLLCYNCNCARAYVGYCPHETNKLALVVNQ